ncbi:MAG: trehalose-phosphatase [Elusimicrobia bacterium]|jgi:trehalose-phosphatase|nr:trehalose-phosphatase [Elusimicrobiota bacterium]
MKKKTDAPVKKKLSWPVLTRCLAREKNVLLVLDFDGTLAPLVRVPDTAQMRPRMYKLLVKLKRHSPLHVAVISGRSLDDIRKRVGVPRLTYGGSHGMEIRGPGFVFNHREALLLRPVVIKLVKDCRRAFSSVKGVRIEPKRLGVAVHYREVDAALVPRLLRLLGQFQKRSQSLPVRWRQGHKVWEAVPRVGWDKGEALLLLSRHLNHPYPIVIGDDLTDEDMFRVVGSKGISIRVAPLGRTQAQYILKNQEEVFSVLERVDQFFLEKR